MTRTHYPIGTPGQPWGAAEKAQWLAAQNKKRSYQDEVVAPLRAYLSHNPALAQAAEQLEYGQLDYSDRGLGKYPLFAVRSRNWQAGLPVVLVTGGVHGYETSGVQGALQFIAEHFTRYSGELNLLVLPCISPWAYETINRWNPDAIDPNRFFVAASPSQEAAAAMRFVKDQPGNIIVHIDLHETTDSDNDEFGPAKAARDGIAPEWNETPDGFYLCGDAQRPEPDFQRALIEAVSQVTHIAPADDKGCIIGSPVHQEGVIYYEQKALGLCGGMTDAEFTSTTEVYPDSPKISPTQCNLAQVTTICAAIDYVRGCLAG
ncbi:M14 family metallocarboxypeptidase [Chitinibacter sp. S2-10]|uniref:M14 family metallopeptidase n=1 Tax=Chitinibacter sp. S2-10 TaxID=3373597 RepID=UPI003977A3CE